MNLTTKEINEVDTDALKITARALVAGDKDLPAMDENNPTCDKRFANLGIPQTPGRLIDVAKVGQGTSPLTRQSETKGMQR